LPAHSESLIENTMNQDPRHFDEEVDEVKRLLLGLGRSVQERLQVVVQALVNRNHEALAKVMERDPEIDRVQAAIDTRCFTLIALNQPVAGDLRHAVSTLKINEELKRVADLAIDIAGGAQRYLRHEPVRPLMDLPRMSELALKMLREALDAFVSTDGGSAKAVLKQDAWLAALKDQIVRVLLTFMLSDPRTVEAGTDLILISRQLERIGDHATNIAEDVIFIVEGRDIRRRPASLTAASRRAPAGVVERRRDAGMAFV
jgi:phosphate transport system protein